MTKDFLIDQTIHNEANLEIGLNWAEFHELPNNAPLEQVQTILESIIKD